MLFQANIPNAPFKQWLWKDPENKRLLILSAIVMALQFAWFKYLYPFPNFMPPDSNSYLEAAYYNQSINMWAIGYPKFLRLVSSFTNSHFALTLIQYLLLEYSLLYFLFALRYLLMSGKWLFRILVLCCVLNPLVPHISNFVSSDGLFTALSLIWFTQLIWLLYKPHRRLLFFHAFILLFAFMVRYNALFYPLISIIVIVSTQLSTKVKTVGIGLIVLLVGGFTGRIIYKYYIGTQTIQYSPFGGWLMAANALYGYAYAVPEPTVKVPAQFQTLHAIVNRHMDSIRNLHIRPDEEVGVYYAWDEASPLKLYMKKRYEQDSVTPYFIRWARVAPLYGAYGRYLMLQHPFPFIKHYLWPNFTKYYAPPTKFMGYYNLGETTVDAIAVEWFGWRDNKVSTQYGDARISVTEIFSILIAVINVLFVLSFIGFISVGGLYKCFNLSKKVLCWTIIIWFGNMLFSVFSAPIELRYQLFPMIMTFVFSVLIIESIARESATL